MVKLTPHVEASPLKTDLLTSMQSPISKASERQGLARSAFLSHDEAKTTSDLRSSEEKIISELRLIGNIGELSKVPTLRRVLGIPESAIGFDSNGEVRFIFVQGKPLLQLDLNGHNLEVEPVTGRITCDGERILRSEISNRLQSKSASIGALQQTAGRWGSVLQASLDVLSTTPLGREVRGLIERNNLPLEVIPPSGRMTPTTIAMVSADMRVYVNAQKLREQACNFSIELGIPEAQVEKLMGVWLAGVLVHEVEHVRHQSGIETPQRLTAGFLETEVLSHIAQVQFFLELASQDPLLVKDILKSDSSLRSMTSYGYRKGGEMASYIMRNDHYSGLPSVHAPLERWREFLHFSLEEVVRAQNELWNFAVYPGGSMKERRAALSAYVHGVNPDNHLLASSEIPILDQDSLLKLQTFFSRELPLAEGKLRQTIASVGEKTMREILGATRTKR
jgi:hypothetical protein